MYDLVVIGASWGGLTALERVLFGLPRAFRVPIAIAQPRSAASLASSEMLSARR